MVHDGEYALKMEERNLKLKNGVSRWKMIQKMILIKHKKEVLQPRILIFNKNQMYSLFHSIRITIFFLQHFFFAVDYTFGWLQRY